MTRATKVARVMTFGAGVVASAACISYGTIESLTVDCNGHGKVDAGNISGACVCSDGYAGSNCEQCDTGYQDHDENGTCLPSCPADLICGEFEACDDSSGVAICACLAGHQGVGCQDCMPDYADLNGDGICDETCASADFDCGPNSTCDDTGSEAVCSCNAGYQDNDGDGNCAPDCSLAQLACVHGACTDASGAAVCECEDGYQGTRCDQCVAGYQDNDSNGTCLPDCTTAGYTCSGHGVCSDANGIAHCDCSDGYHDDGQGNCASLSYIVTAVNDGLDQEDLQLMDNGLSQRGYYRETKDTNVSRSELVQYLETPVTFLYHTGHGSEGEVMTSTGSLTTSSARIKVANTVFATCLTLADNNWTSAFGDSAQSILGYTKLSYDFTDNQVVKTMLDELDDGRDYLQAWYLANVAIGSMKDRWAAYVREGQSITEYSARSGNAPTTLRSDTFTIIDGVGRVRVTSSVLNNDSTFVNATNVLPYVGRETGTTQVTPKFAATTAERRTAGSLSEPEAIAAAIQWLESTGGLPFDAELDTVVHVDARAEDGSSDLVGHTVIFGRTWGGYPVRSNGRAHRLTVFVGAEGVLAATRYWPTLDVSKGKPAPTAFLNVPQAVHLAAQQIGRALKSNDETVDLVAAQPVFGAASPSGSDVALRPAYDLISGEGFHFIVDAVTGQLVL